MIDIAQIHEIQTAYINDIVEKDRAQRMSELNKANDRRKDRMDKAEAAKKEAEELLPTILLKLDASIKEKAAAGGTDVSYKIPENMTGMYVVVMLVSILPMHGLLWNIKDNALKVSW